MKKIVSVITISIMLAAIPAFAAKRLSFTELPESVQKAIVSQKSGDEKGMTIKEEVEEGSKVYKVTMKRDGGDTKLWIKADGTIVKDNQGGNAVTASKPAVGFEIKEPASAQKSAEATAAANAKKDHKSYLAFSELPKAVQETVTAQKGDSDLAKIKIHQESKDGKTFYKVKFKKEGKDAELHIAEDGTILEKD